MAVATTVVPGGTTRRIIRRITAVTVRTLLGVVVNPTIIRGETKVVIILVIIIVEKGEVGTNVPAILDVVLRRTMVPVNTVVRAGKPLLCVVARLGSNAASLMSNIASI